MKSNYRKIGKHIQLVDERNSDLELTTLLGLTINKEFIPSVANTVGTDMANYKIIRKNQFACSLMQVRRDKKIPVALLKDFDEAIISQAYPVFEVIDTELLLPEYLMMWMSRSEFDRETCFYAIGGVRGSLEWEDFCNMELPLPDDIKKQKAIVEEYNIIVNRIKLNEELNKKLEETAQAIYKQWFVDFEFPNENGKPYKSNGGEMVWNEELGNETPSGWKVKGIGNYVKLSQGQVINAETRHLVKEKGFPLLRITDLINGTQEVFIDELVAKKNIAKMDEIIFTRTGHVGLVFRKKEGVVHNNCFKVIPTNSKLTNDYLFWFLKSDCTYTTMVGLASGSVQADLTHSAFLSVILTIPTLSLQSLFSKMATPLESQIELLVKQNRFLIELKNLILSKMTKAY